MGLGGGDDVHPCFESGEDLSGRSVDELLAARNRLDHNRSGRGGDEVLQPRYGLPQVPRRNCGWVGLAVCTEDNLLVCASDAREPDADPISAMEL